MVDKCVYAIGKFCISYLLGYFSIILYNDLKGGWNGDRRLATVESKEEVFKKKVITDINQII